MPDINKTKIEGQFRGQLRGILGVFNLYGMDVYIPQVIDQIVKKSYVFSDQLHGNDRPYEEQRGWQ